MRRVSVNDLMQSGYSYILSARTGRDFDPGFEPDLAPAEMPALGVARHVVARSEATKQSGG